MGQAANSAANCFMKALINNRRRGLAGSVIDISRILGVGFVEREIKAEGRLTKEQTERLMHRTGTLPMSEPDLHQLFAEAIIGGRPGDSSHTSSEIITGLAPITSGQVDMAFWASNPKFGHLIHEQTTSSVQGDYNATVHIPIRAQLQAAKTPVEVSNILLVSLLSKLRASLFLSATEPLSQKMPLT